ncbi:IclR family transcriptional regulator [Corynebacterium sp. 32222D000AT]
MRKIQVPAAHNALRILSLLSTIDVPISAARIRSELDLPRSSTYHLLNELVESGFVVHLPENQTYGLGLAAYAMASAYTTQQPLVRMSHRYVEQAANLAGGSGHLSRLAGSEVVYLHEVRSPGAVSLVTEVGVRLQALRSASGRVMLAYLPEAEARATFATAGQEGSLRQFRERLAQVRERGWEEETEEISRGQASLAVPVLDHLARPAASLAVTFGVGRLGDATRAAVLDHLQSSARQIATRMYGSR